MSLGFIPDVSILSATFILMVVFRRKIAKLFLWIPSPKFLIYLISSIPFILIEENINCLPTGCVFIPWTVPYLLAFVLVLGLLFKFRPKSMKYPLAIFIMSGILWEIFFGGLKGQLSMINPGFYIFMVFYVGLSYAYLIIVPLTILKEEDEAAKLHASNLK